MARKDRDRNEVEIDLDKYMALLDQLDEQEDQIKQLKDDARFAAFLSSSCPFPLF